MALSAVCVHFDGSTTTLNVGSLVFDNDYRHPIVLAKEIATLDLASEGRVEFGIGAGWMKSDYEQSGLPYDSPGVRIDRAPLLVGLSASRTGAVQLEPVRVPRKWLLAGPMHDVMKQGLGARTGGHQTSALAIGLATLAAERK